MHTPDAPDPDPADAANAPGGMILRRFRVEKILGRGGMGEVLLAHDTLLNRRVALKRLRARDEHGAVQRSAILKEARRASQITDRRIAAIYDVLDLDDDVLIVMEYVDGTTLRERMSRPLPIAEFWDLSIQCVEAVAAAHAHGVIHRDIKPENLMVTGDGQIKILDFGIARRAEPVPGERSIDATTMTMETGSRVIAGTPQYMAPEAHFGGTIDRRTDIFSLGTVFYELLTANPPFAGPTYESVFENVMVRTPRPVTEVNPAVGKRLSDVIAKMMAKDPAERYTTCADLMKGLAGARAAAARPEVDPAPDERVTPAAGRRRVGSSQMLVIALVTIAVGASAWGVWTIAFGPTVPRDRNLAVLAPTTPGAGDDFANFALGSIDRLTARLQKHQDRSGFQLASFQDVRDGKPGTAVESRKVLGVNLALLTTLEQRSDVFRGRLDLWDAVRGKVLGSRVFETPASRPFEFQDRLYRAAVDLMRLTARQGEASSEFGVRGAGTLRFLLQGIGRIRNAGSADEAGKAVEDLQLACRTEPASAAAMAWLAAAQLKGYNVSDDRGWLDQAEASARRAVALDSTRVEPHRVLGSVLASEKNPAASLVELKRVCELDPTDDDAWLRMSRSYARLGQRDKEKEAILAAISRRPHCWPPYWWLATWEFREGHVEQAIHAYEEMVRRAPDLHKGYASLGGVLVFQGDYDRAIVTLNHAVALYPTKIAFDNLGTAYFNSHRLDEAIDAYNQSFQFGLADYASWLNLGDAYYWLRNRQDQAMDAYRQAVRLGREADRTRAQQGRTFDVMIPANLATVFPKLGQPDSARAYLGRALNADSTNSMVQYCAALTCWQLSRRDQAITWLERAVRGGYSLAWLRDSPVFQEWRADERFRALIADAGPNPQRAPAGPGERR